MYLNTDCLRGRRSNPLSASIGKKQRRKWLKHHQSSVTTKQYSIKKTNEAQLTSYLSSGRSGLFSEPPARFSDWVVWGSTNRSWSSKVKWGGVSSHRCSLSSRDPFSASCARSEDTLISQCAKHRAHVRLESLYQSVQCVWPLCKGLTWRACTGSAHLDAPLLRANLWQAISTYILYFIDLFIIFCLYYLQLFRWLLVYILVVAVTNKYSM